MNRLLPTPPKSESRCRLPMLPWNVSLRDRLTAEHELFARLAETADPRTVHGRTVARALQRIRAELAAAGEPDTFDLIPHNSTCDTEGSI